MLFVFLAGLSLVLTGEVSSVFQPNQLPAQKTYTLTNGAYRFPVHFGGVGTMAYENFILLRYPGQGESLAVVHDCFCPGDAFIMHLTDVETGITQSIPPDDYIPYTDCISYVENFGVCYVIQTWSKSGLVLPEVEAPVQILNVTIEVIAAPYGGGVAYFVYAPLSE